MTLGSELPLTLKCPVGGEDWPVTGYRSYVDTTKKKGTMGSVKFICPAHHCFTLRKAWKARLFNKEQVARILAEAERLVAQSKSD